MSALPYPYPLRFKPVYKDYIWGGDWIIRKFGRNEPDGVYAESWEATDRPDGMSVVANGDLKGKTFRDLIESMGAELLGTHGGGDHFPLLIKLIDSRQCLSVQVHPNDETAAKYGGEAKTEMWYVLDAEPGARVLAGLKPGVDARAFREAIETNRFEEILVPVPVSAGDAIFIPGGRVHAIDKGCLLLEVQQNSNTTYRIYDWGRLGADGKPRPLHIEKALQVIDWLDEGNPKVQPRKIEKDDGNDSWEILTTPYFRLEKFQLNESWSCPGHPGTFQVLFVQEGRLELEWAGGSEIMEPGTTWLVPAALPGFTATPTNQPVTLLRTYCVPAG